MQSDYLVKQFDSAIKNIEPGIRKILSNLTSDEKARVYEIRLRSEREVLVCGSFGTRFLCSDSTLSEKKNEKAVMCSVEKVADTFNRLCCYSVHSYMTGIVKGYITMQGGHRAGITGTAVCDSNGNITSIKDISGINIRVSKEITGCADKIIREVYEDELQSVIVAGPPSSGKTTVLRDIVRQLSSEDRLYKVALVDERREIASMNSGIPQNDVGINTDVLDSYPKTEALVIALKTLSPDIIALDEVSEEKEIEKIRMAVNSGVKFILTVHASDYNELLHRPQIQRILETYSFSKLIMLKKSPVGEIADIYDTKELRDEIIRCRHNLDLFDPCGDQWVGSA